MPDAEIKTIHTFGTDIARPLRGKLTAQEMNANGQLIARLSPETAMKVYALAEQIAHDKPGNLKDSAIEIIALLDGKK